MTPYKTPSIFSLRTTAHHFLTFSSVPSLQCIFYYKLIINKVIVQSCLSVHIRRGKQQRLLEGLCVGDISVEKFLDGFKI